MMSAPALTKKKLESILKKHYAIGFLISFERMKKGLGNVLYRVRTTRGDFTLKIAMRNNPIRVRYEIELLEHLTKLPVPHLIKTKAGGYFFSYGKYKSFMYAFLPGAHASEITPAMLREVGTFLGKLHLQTKGFTSRVPRMRFYDITSKNIAVVMRDSRKVQNPKLRDAAEYMGKELLKYRLPKKLPEGAMHIDVKPENTLFKNGHLSGVVDFDNSYNGPLVLDLANTLMWYCSRQGVFDMKKARIIYRAYAKVRKLSHTERNALFDTLHYAFLTHVLADIYLEFSKDYPMIRIPESYMLWEVDNLLASQQNLKITKREFQKSLN